MQKLACPLDAYPDEIFYSILSRFKERLDTSSRKYFSDLCFGSRNVTATIEFPSHLDNFSSSVQNSTLTTDKIIEKHSLLPYFAPFLPYERVWQLRNDMATNNGHKAHMRAGIMASKISSPPFLRICSECIIDDQREYGECYWHRVHQLPGVLICPMHHINLSTSIVDIRRGARQDYRSAESILKELGDQNNQPLAFHAVLAYIADNSLMLLNTPITDFASNDTKARYRFLLYQNGYCNYSGRINTTKKLIENFNEFFGKDLLKTLDCTVDAGSDNWLFKIIRHNEPSQHPLRHLLIMQFIGLTPEKLFSIKIPEPFGDSPWPCLNRASDHYLAGKINKVMVVQSKYTNGKPIGQFTCDCGFSYQRTGPDTKPGDRLRIDKIKSYGLIWKRKLIDLWTDKSKSLREIARSLGVDSKTTKQEANTLNLNFPRHGPRISRTRPKITSARNQITKNPKDGYRANWLELKAQNPNKGVKELRQLCPGVYSWLYRNDSEWLAENKPPRKTIVSAYNKRIDWDRRDELIAEKIPSAVQDLKAGKSKPIRITISSIARKIGKLSLIQKCMNKLPRTALALSRFVETPEQYAIQKISWAVQVFQQQGTTPKRWQIVRLAGIERQKTKAPVKNALDASFNEQGNIF